jgi:GNAT superfamily N-acetyltransferase
MASVGTTFRLVANSYVTSDTVGRSSGTPGRCEQQQPGAASPRGVGVQSVSSCGSSLHGYCSILHPNQWELVRRLRLEALRTSPQAFLGSYEREKLRVEDDWRKTFESASWHGFFIGWNVASSDGMAGIAKSSTEYPGERFVEAFWVRPRYRRRQVARRMLDSIIHEARAEELGVIRLNVRRINEQAIDAFRKLGFSTDVPSRSNPCELCLELRIS